MDRRLAAPKENTRIFAFAVLGLLAEAISRSPVRERASRLAFRDGMKREGSIPALRGLPYRVLRALGPPARRVVKCS